MVYLQTFILVKGLNSLDEHASDAENDIGGKVGGLPDEVVNSAQCVENKCLIDDSTLDAPPLAGEEPRLKMMIWEEILFELRRQCVGEVPLD